MAQPVGVCSQRWVSDVTAKTSSLPEESVTALIDKMVPPGESNRQWSPAKRELFSQRELSVSTAKITALPTAFVAALSCRKEPAERYAQPATVCSQRWWSAVIA